MPDNIALRAKFPHGFGSSDGACAWDGASSYYKPNTSVVNGGSHDAEGWFPVENAPNQTYHARVPYTSTSGTTSGYERVVTKATDGVSSTWPTWNSAAGYGLQYQCGGYQNAGETFTNGSLELHTNPSSGAGAQLTAAKPNQIWKLSWHAYTGQTGNASFWIFFLNSSYNHIIGSYDTMTINDSMVGDEAKSHLGSYGFNTNNNGHGFSNRYNDTYTQSNPYYTNNKGGYNFMMVDVPQSDYTYFEVYFKVPASNSTEYLSWRWDMDTVDFFCNMDLMRLVPCNVSLKDCNGGSGTNISMDDIVNA